MVGLLITFSWLRPSIDVILAFSAQDTVII